MTDPFPRAAGSLGRAFHDDPLMRFVLPDAAARSAALPRLFRSVLHFARRFGGVGLADGGLGAVTWLPRRNYPLRWSQVLRSGLALLPLRLGVRATWRLERHESAGERAEVRHFGPRTGYLWVLGVDPDAQGKGHARRLVEAACAALADDHDACVLRTENPRNVPIYEHLGFQVAEQVTVRFSGLDVWVLRKDLRAKPDGG